MKKFISANLTLALICSLIPGALYADGPAAVNTQQTPMAVSRPAAQTQPAAVNRTPSSNFSTLPAGPLSPATPAQSVNTGAQSIYGTPSVAPLIAGIRNQTSVGPVKYLVLGNNNIQPEPGKKLPPVMTVVQRYCKVDSSSSGSADNAVCESPSYYAKQGCATPGAPLTCSKNSFHFTVSEAGKYKLMTTYTWRDEKNILHTSQSPAIFFKINAAPVRPRSAAPSRRY